MQSIKTPGLFTTRDLIYMTLIRFVLYKELSNFSN